MANPSTSNPNIKRLTVMKKIYFVMAVLATALLASCEKEKSFEGLTPLAEGDIAFTIQGMTTKSSVGANNAVTGVTIPLGVKNGEALCLEETIEELNPNPGTKGAPAYTVNVGSIYKSLGVYDSTTEGEVSFEVMDTYQHDKDDASLGDGWRYRYNYPGTDPWPSDATDDVDFYLRMPVGGTGVSVTGRASGSTTFTLTSPLDGAEQQDLLFGYVAASKQFHDSKLPNGVPVTMYHALSGIRFRNGHPNNNQTKTIITKVEFVGLNGSGTCSISADGTASWTNPGTPSTAEAPFVLEFNNPTYVKNNGASNPDGTVSPAAEGQTPGDYNWNSSLNGTSWTAAAADKNLNNPDGSLTFWFIPQEMTRDVILKVYFTVKTPDSVDGFVSDACHIINLGELLNENYAAAGKTGSVKWDAGQLRTYTLKPFDVDVDIKDVMTSTTKSKLHIANTGNVDEYVRLLIMGNWYGWMPDDDGNYDPTTEPSILVGYQYESKEAATAAGHSEDPMIDSWFREGYDGEDPYGTFDNSFLLAHLSDERDGVRGDWADASGGFYYTLPIGPGAGVNTVESATKDLFKSYTVTNVPTIYLAKTAKTRVAAKGVHLRMEIVVQAIAVPTEQRDGVTKNVWWLKAWYDATGVAKLNPSYTDNAKFVTRYNNGEYDVTY